MTLDQLKTLSILLNLFAIAKEGDAYSYRVNRLDVLDQVDAAISVEQMRADATHGY